MKRIDFLKKVQKCNSFMKKDYSLRPFQVEAVAFLLTSWRCIVALPTGLGKTYASLSAYTFLKERKPNLKLLYVSEKSILPQTATEDLPKFFKGLEQAMIFENTPKQRLKIYQDFKDCDKDILFMNYHTLKNDEAILTDLFRALNIMIIYDEADNISGDSAISKSANKFSKLAYRVFALTATPSKSNLEHIHNIFTNIGNKQITQTEFRTKHCIIEKNLTGMLTHNGKKLSNLFGQANPLGTSFMGSFRKALYEAKYFNRIVIKQNLQRGKITLFNEAKMTFKITVPSNFIGSDYFIVILYNDKKKKKKVFNLRLSAFPNVGILGYKNISSYVEKTKDYMFVKSKRDVAKDIPPFTIYKLYFKEDKETMTSLRDYYSNTDVTSSAKISIGLSMPQLLEVDGVENNINPLHINNKVKEVIRIVIKAHFEGEKIIIFSPYRTVIERLVDIMLEKKIITTKTYNMITGTSHNKAIQKKQFVEDIKRDVMFITEAGLKGLNLQVANNLIIFNMPKSAGDVLQLAGRISRIGTEYSNLNIYIPMHEASNDVDMYHMIFGQVAFIYRLNPQLIDGGLYDDTLEELEEKEADLFLKRSLVNRKARYVK